MANIKVTPEELESQGNDLKGYAEDLRGILSNIESKISEIDGGWDGLGQDAYLDMYSNMKQSLDQFPDIVDSLGDATVSAAQAYAGVDEQLQSSFKSGGQ